MLRKSSRCVQSAGVLVAVMVFAGCGSGDGIDRRAIEGRVTLDAAPLKSGSIRFEPAQGRGVASGAAIVDGAYTIPADQGLAPGTYRVSISSAGDAAPRTPSMDNEAPLPEEQIPARYNTQTELQITLAADGKTEFLFELSSAPE